MSLSIPYVLRAARDVAPRVRLSCGDRELTVAELDRETEDTAHDLLRRGYGPGSRRVVSGAGSAAMIERLALARMGALIGGTDRPLEPVVDADLLVLEQRVWSETPLFDTPLGIATHGQVLQAVSTSGLIDPTWPADLITVVAELLAAGADPDHAGTPRGAAPTTVERRLASVYDVLEGERDDLDAYESMVEEVGARRVLDVGCGTGELAIRLATIGCEVIGVDPDAAALEVARGKYGADAVTWVHGDARTVAGRTQAWADVAVMTANVAQVFVDERYWTDALRAVHTVLRPGGTFVFESRDPAVRAWEGWTPGETRTRQQIADIGEVESWCEVTAVELPLVTFRWTTTFDDGVPLTEDTTLIFRSRTELLTTVEEAGFTELTVGDAPDRPGREFVVRGRSAAE